MEARNHNQKWVINVKSLKLIPLNQFADKDDIISVSAKVNNPSAISERDTSKIVGWVDKKKYYDLMKIVFNYEKCK